MTKYLFLIITICLLSCVYDPPEQHRLDVYGYYCGDSIDARIVITDTGNSWIGFGNIKGFEIAEVLLFNNHIERIYIDSLSQSKSDSFSILITKAYRRKPQYYEDSRFPKLFNDTEEFYWYDSVSHDEISILRKRRDNPDSISSLWLENRQFSDSYREKIFGPETELEFEPELELDE